LQIGIALKERTPARKDLGVKLVKGDTLSKLLSDRTEPTSERGKFVGIFGQICQTMAYAHSRGVIHRDLKPANIMVGAFGEVQVMDWGLAKVLPAGGVADEKKARDKQLGQSITQTLRSEIGSDAPGTFGTLGSQTQVGSVMSTPAYMPPEQALGEIDQLDERADVFGLGAILAEILTGKPPYVADGGTRIFRLASRGKLDDCFVRLEACGADEDLMALTKHCRELEPRDRPRNAGELAERVSGYLESVESRLRAAEIDRAAHAARADAEAEKAAAETKRAEAEAARAREEIKRRRTSLALAASVLLLARSEQLVYASKLMLAQNDFDAGNGGLAQFYLDECQSSLRGWEYRYLRTRTQSKQTLVGHTDEVRSAAFSPDGKRVVTASLDGTAKVWDTKRVRRSSPSGHRRNTYSAWRSAPTANASSPAALVPALRRPFGTPRVHPRTTSGR